MLDEALDWGARQLNKPADRIDQGHTLKAALLH